MAKIRTQAAKVGIFVVTVAAILLLALFLIGGLSFWRRVDTYHVITSKGALGIDVNSVVTLRGVAIGKVKAIEIDQTDFARVTIDLEIDPDVKIPTGSKAYFEQIGLTGERAINITGGTLADGQLAPGSTIPREETALERLASRADELGTDLSTLITDLTATAEEINVLVDDIDALVAAVDPKHVTELVAAVDPERVESMIEHAERSTRTIASTSRQLERAVVEGRVDIGKITQDFDHVATKSAKTLARADAAAKALLDMIADADAILKANRDDLRVALRNLRQASQEAQAFIEELRDRPSLLLRSKSREKREKRKKRKKREKK